jgi:hypothetical protein
MQTQLIGAQFIQGLHLRVMTQIRYIEHQSLRFQVGQMVEQSPAVWLFHLRGFGSTRDAALAMAGLSSTVTLQEEIY